MQSSVELRINEEVLAIVRKSAIYEIFRFSISIVFLLIPFFFFFPLLNLGLFGFALFVILEASAIFFSSKIFITWYYTLLIVTNERIIDADQLGIFKREVTDLEFDDISECVIEKKGLVQKVLNIGSVKIKTKEGNGFDIVFQNISNLNKIKCMFSDVFGKTVKIR
jgi:uncharacterized membrane protein YdbT with pleckstrin-like domain